MVDRTNIANWVRSACCGDQQAWNFLYRSCYANLYRIALEICGNTPYAKDSVQDAFMIAYLKLSQLKEPVAFFSWMERICINCCYRVINKNRFNGSHANLPLEGDQWWEDQVDRKFDHISTEARIFDALVGLPEILRITLLIRYFTNFQSYQEIALILGIPVGTVRSRLHEAKQKMVELWKSNEEHNNRHLREAEEWNGFYFENLGLIHWSLEARNTFYNHLSGDIQFSFTSGKTDFGRPVIQKEIEEDIRHGSFFSDLKVSTSNNISVIEAFNMNSEEFPDRCPESTLLVLYRKGREVVKASLHNS